MKELLEKAQRRAAGLETPSNAHRTTFTTSNSNSGSSSDLDEDVKVVQTKPPKVKAPPTSSSSDSDSDREDVKPPKLLGVRGVKALTTPIKRAPSSSSSSDSEMEHSRNQSDLKGKGCTPKKEVISDESETLKDRKSGLKRKRNSILPRVVENPWKRRVSEVSFEFWRAYVMYEEWMAGFFKFDFFLILFRMLVDGRLEVCGILRV